jgi:hypothetical protein
MIGDTEMYERPEYTFYLLIIHPSATVFFGFQPRRYLRYGMNFAKRRKNNV